MPTADSDFQELIERIQNGSIDAAWELTERYSLHIRRVVRRILDVRLRPQFDSEDFVQSVWKSFFCHPHAIAKCQTPEDFSRHLIAVARNKVVDKYNRAFKTKKNDQALEMRIEADRGLQESLVSREPAPLELAIAKERWNRLFAQQSPQSQAILRQRIAGVPCVEIARQMDLSERTVRRTIDRLVMLKW